MDKDKIQTSLNEAAHADALLRDGFLWEQFDRLEQDYIKAWKVTPARDEDSRERLWQAVNILGLVKGQLHKVLDGGKIAKLDLDRLKQG